MNVELKVSDATDRHIIENLWPLYQHEVSEFDGARPNVHGLFGAADDVTRMVDHLGGLAPWWQEAGALFPYLLLADGQPAGFNLVAARSRIPQSIDADFIVHEFFVLHAYRGQGVAERAAAAGFDLHHGQWEVVTYPRNVRGIAFWRKAIRNYTSNVYSEQEVDHAWGPKVAWEFTNAALHEGPTSPPNSGPVLG